MQFLAGSGTEFSVYVHGNVQPGKDFFKLLVSLVFEFPVSLDNFRFWNFTPGNLKFFLSENQKCFPWLSLIPIFGLIFEVSDGLRKIEIFTR